MKLVAVITTVGKWEDAKQMARTAVESKLAACAQCEEIESIYAWKGKIENAHEIRITLKTTIDRCQALMAQMISTHPYETPAIYAVDIAQAHAPYTEWVVENTTPVSIVPS